MPARGTDGPNLDTLPADLSARTTLSGEQAGIALALLVMAIAGLALAPTLAIATALLLLSAFYLSVVLFRAAVLAGYRLDPPWTGNPQPSGRYAILSALYREAGQVGDLVAALDRLKWPGSAKNVYLICEADDRETIEAIEALGHRANLHLVVVPAGQPRTKPRALNHCLRRITADYLVIYDAEDGPAPGQLLEAWQKFAAAGPEVACLQAPLEIDNAGQSFLTRLFAIEYDTLFHGILPALGRMGAPMPLGGTSNHFRFGELVAAGGWDAYNVTEDADLGVRLARAGYRCETISTPTFEEAPSRLGAWSGQRARWIKGWIQTILVHLRDPRRLAAELGMRNFILFHLLMTAMVISVLVHPFFVAVFLFEIARHLGNTEPDMLGSVFLGLSTFNLVAGYTTYGFLAKVVQDGLGRRMPRLWLLLLPAYWILISVAGWRALAELAIRPHHWHKTQHGETGRQLPAEAVEDVSAEVL